jgi:hypothetical protein
MGRIVRVPDLPTPVVTAAEMVAGHVTLGISCLDRLYLNVIFSHRVRRACDLWGCLADMSLTGVARLALGP